MPQTGWMDLTTFTGTNWTTPSNAGASDDSYATYNTTTQDFLNCENASLAIQDLVPAANAIIRGIEVSIEGNGDSATAADRQIEVFLTKDGSASVGTGKVVTLNQTTDTVQVVGGATDLWGTDLDLAEVRASTFGVFIRDNDTTAAGLDIDHVMIRVYYDEGVRGMFDLNFDGFAEFSQPRQTYLDGWLDYDGGSGGTAPAIGDVIRNADNATIARIIRPSDASVLAFGTMALGDLHHEGGGENVDPATPFDDADTLSICSYVDFDTEQNNGVSETDIGSTMSGGTLSGAVVRHVESHGAFGRIWYTASSGSLADTNAIAIPDGGSTVALANGASVDNAWTGAANGTLYEPKQGYFDYDGEVTALESSSGSERIRSGDAQHNMCVVASNHTHPKWTGMVVDDRPDANAPAEGRMYVFDIDDQTALVNNDTVEALEEIDFDGEVAGPFALDDLIGDAASPTKTARVRRIIDHGDATGLLYVEHVSGARFVNNDEIYVGMTKVADASAAQRQRVGEVTVNGSFVSAKVQWMMSHVYTDVQAQAPVLENMDDSTPMSAQVLDQQYTYLNQYTLSHFSTRRVKKGSIKQIGETGGADDDSIYTDYRSIQTLANNLSGADPIAYAEQPPGSALAQHWDAGLVSALVRNKENNAKISSGNVTWYFREWGTLFTHVTISQVGGQPPITGDTFVDSANQTAESTVEDGAAYQNIRVSFASHLVEFDGGSGTMVLSDVLYNATRTSAAMVVRVPANQVSGTDLHVASDGVDITDWVDADGLVTLTRLEFDTVTADADGNARVFAVGDAIDNGSGVTANVRLVRQYGTSRGTIWVSDIAGGSFSDSDPLEVGATQYATMDGDQIAGSGWTGDVHTAGAAADNTVLKDIGNGSDDPYNGVVDCDAQTVQVMYEFLKFLARRQAGSPLESGGLLYPNNTLTQGRFYQRADSAYGAVDVNKQAPFGSKPAPAADFFGARGIFIENMDAADVQAYQLIDAGGTTRNPPNLQASSVTSLAIGDAVTQFRRPTVTASLTYNAGTPATITQGSGDFLDDGFRDKTTITVSGTASNDGDFEVDTVVALTITLKSGETLTNEGPVSSTIEGHNANRDQFSGDATGNDLGDPDFDTTGTLPSDLPASGTFIVTHKDGTEVASGYYTDVYSYASYAGEVFTLASGSLVRGYDGDARVMVPMLYKIAAASTESQTIIYSADFPTLTRVRRKGIIPFEILGTFTATGLTTAAIRGVDPIVE